MLVAITRNAGEYQEWFDVFGRALTEAGDDGLFAAEFRAWFVRVQEPFGDAPLDPDDKRRAREFDANVNHSIHAFTRWGLISAEREYPERVYRESHFDLFAEPLAKLTPRGARLFARSARRQMLFFWPRVAVVKLAPVAKALRTPLLVGGWVLSGIEVFTQWPTIHAVGASAVAVVVIALAELSLRARPTGN